MSNIRLIDLLPLPYYQDVREMILLMEVQQYQLDDLQRAIDRTQKNLFAIVADEKGLAIFEEMLDIPPNNNIDIEARRFTVISKMLPPRPITVRTFNEILIALNINARMEVNGFEVSVLAETTDTQSLRRLNVLLRSYLPANMIFASYNFYETSTQGETKHGTGQLLATRITSKSSEYAD